MLLSVFSRSAPADQPADETTIDRNEPKTSEPRIGFASDGRAWLRVQANGATCYASADFKFIAPI